MGREGHAGRALEHDSGRMGLLFRAVDSPRTVARWLPRNGLGRERLRRSGRPVDYGCDYGRRASGWECNLRRERPLRRERWRRRARRGCTRMPDRAGSHPRCDQPAGHRLADGRRLLHVYSGEGRGCSRSCSCFDGSASARSCCRKCLRGRVGRGLRPPVGHGDWGDHVYARDAAGRDVHASVLVGLLGAGHACLHVRRDGLHPRDQRLLLERGSAHHRRRRDDR